MSESEVTLLVGAGTAAGAFLGVFVTALLSRASATSTLRQKWIDSLREILSKFLTQSEIYIETPNKGGQEAYKEKIALRELIHQVKLFLNEKEKISGDLLKIMQDLPDKYANVSNPVRDYQTEKPIISSMMQNVLKQEWNRVRDGEILWSINNFFNFVGLPNWFYLSRIRLFWIIVLPTVAWAMLKFYICN